MQRVAVLVRTALLVVVMGVVCFAPVPPARTKSPNCRRSYERVPARS